MSVWVIDNGESYSDHALHFVSTTGPNEEKVLKAWLELPMWRKGWTIVAKADEMVGLHEWWTQQTLADFLLDNCHRVEPTTDEQKAQARAFLEMWDKAGLGKRPWIDGLAEVP